MRGQPRGWASPREFTGVPLVPYQIGGLEIWFDAAYITGLSDGDGVASWLDRSGNGRHAVQGIAGLRPLYKTGIQNGLPVVRGDGSDDVLVTAAFDINWGTVFMVFGDWTFTGGAEAWGHVLGSASMRVGTIFAAPTNMYADDNDLHENGVQSHIHRVDGVVTDSTTDQNFHVVTLKSQSAVSYGSSVLSLLDSVLNVNMQGDLCAFLVYNTILNSANETRVEDFLKDKWGTP